MWPVCQLLTVKPATDLAVIKPEDVKNIEVGIKTTPIDNFTLNLTFFNTDIEELPDKCSIT